MFAADLGDAYIRGFACFREGVVARIEVFAFLGKGRYVSILRSYAV
jgi:hypothetical protein